MKRFKGPLFIVGMPRSGTKLLRDLLNQHPEINIPEVETIFFPSFIKKYGEHFDFNAQQKGELFEEFFKTPFFWNIKNLGYAIDESFVAKQNKVSNWKEFAGLIFSYFGPKAKQSDLILGDKTPQYINSLELFKRVWPEAKFIHIIRDPRDVSISVKNIWNKNMFRSAYIWNETLEKTLGFKQKFSSDYIEMKYEDLISDVESAMMLLSSFLEIEYAPSMCTLAKPAENYGDAKGKNNVVNTNKQKFLNRLNQKEIGKIEEITFSEMVRLKYEPLYAKNKKIVKPLLLQYWKLNDAYNSVKFHVKEKGFTTGLSYFFKSYKLISKAK